MSKVVSIPTEDNADLGICYKTMPPILIPISDRAKKELPTGEADCVIFLEDNADAVIETLDEDLVVVLMDEYTPQLIAHLTINMLH